MRLSCPSSCANDIFVHHPHTLSSSYSTLGPLLNSVEEASIGCMGNRWPPEVKVHTGSSLAAPEGVSLPSWCFRKMSSTLNVYRLHCLLAECYYCILRELKPIIVGLHPVHVHVLVLVNLKGSQNGDRFWSIAISNICHWCILSHRIMCDTWSGNNCY